MSDTPSERFRARILEAFPAHAAREGWTETAFKAAVAEAGLSEEERQLVRQRDWRGMIHYGVIFFMLEKLGAAVGVSNLHIYAAMRGEPLEEFLKTRNAKVMYSVAGGAAAKGAAWDSAKPDGAATEQAGIASPS